LPLRLVAEVPFAFPYGFIKTAGTKDPFFHSSSVQGVTFEELREGQDVSYTEAQGKKGLCAENVKPI
jgi:cold shock protein